MEPRLLEHVRAHHQVRVPVAARVLAVGADAADLGGKVEDELGCGLVEEPGRVVHRRQVVVRTARDRDLVPVALEPLDEMRAEKASTTGDEHAHRRKATSSDRPGTVAALDRPPADLRALDLPTRVGAHRFFRRASEDASHLGDRAPLDYPVRPRAASRRGRSSARGCPRTSGSSAGHPPPTRPAASSRSRA